MSADRQGWRQAVPGERAARGGKKHPIPIAKLRPADRASEHLHLVTEDGVLELELRDDPTPGEQPDEAQEHDVGQGSQGARDATYHRQSERNRVFWSPTGRLLTDRIALAVQTSPGHPESPETQCADAT